MTQYVISIETSKKGKKYATDSNGLAMFPQTPAIAEKLVAGCLVNTINRERTQTLNEAGELVNLEHPVMETIITAVFASEEAAIKAKAQPQIFELKTKAYVNQQVAAVAAEYKVDAKTLEAAL